MRVFLELSLPGHWSSLARVFSSPHLISRKDETDEYRGAISLEGQQLRDFGFRIESDFLAAGQQQ